MSFQGSTFNIPIRVTFFEGYPARAPIVQVLPTADMVISPNEYVRQDGTVLSQMIQKWNPACNCDALLKDLIAAFTYKMPVFAKPENRAAVQIPPTEARNGRGSLVTPGKEPEVRAKEGVDRKVIEGTLRAKLQTEWDKVRKDIEELERERREIVSSKEEALQARSLLETQVVPIT